MSKKTLNYGILGVVLAAVLLLAAPRAMACDSSGCLSIPQIPTFQAPEIPTVSPCSGSACNWKPVPNPTPAPVVVTPTSPTVEQNVTQSAEASVKVEVNGNDHHHDDHHDDHHDHCDHNCDHHHEKKVIEIVKALPVTGSSFPVLVGLAILSVLIAFGIVKSYRARLAK